MLDGGAMSKSLPGYWQNTSGDKPFIYMARMITSPTCAAPNAPTFTRFILDLTLNMTPADRPSSFYLEEVSCHK